MVATAAASPPALQVSRKAGYPRHWHAGQPIAKEALVNVRNGNLHNIISLCPHIIGTGPDLRFDVYGNHLSAVSGLTISAPASGINLVKCFTHTYHGQLHFVSGTVTRLLEDDGTYFDFTWNSGTSTWDPPAGYTQTLVQQGNEWRLTYKDQSCRRFANPTGRLLAEGDASGNEAVCSYETVGLDARLLNVTDARGRQITFAYDGTTGRLATITAPWGASNGTSTPATRSWGFSYDGNGWLNRIDDPMDMESTGDPNDFMVKCTFDTAGRIRTVTDANSNAYEVLYHSTSGLVDTVKDPSPFQTQTQTFSYDSDTQQPTFDRVYTDRRGAQWTYKFHTSDNVLIELKDPLLHVTFWQYDSYRNKTSFTNGVLKTWTFTWDAKANLLTITNHLGQKWTWTWNSLNQVTSITPPLNNSGGANNDKKVEFFYDDTTNATAVTRIHEPTTPAGGSPIVTTLTYFGTGDSTPAGSAKGLLKQVVDPNSVKTQYTYDTYGMPDTMKEGDNSVDESYDYCNGGTMTGTISDFGGCNLYFNSNGWATSLAQCITRPETGPPAEALWTGFPATCSNPTLYDIKTTAATWTFDNTGKILTAYFNTNDNSTGENSLRNRTLSFDNLDRMTQNRLVSDEATWNAPGSPDVLRQFDYFPNWVTGTYDYTGPDGQTVEVDTDTGRRVTATLRAGNTTIYGYDNADRLTSVDYQNATQALYQYDDADRVTQIHHKIVGGQTLIKLDYVYAPEGLVSTITEYDNVGLVATTTFSYDNRNRLTREVRSGTYPYEMTYTYDVGGNRTSKVDGVNGYTTTYVYDVVDPTAYGSKNNRLMWYEVRNSLNQLQETVYYAYYKGGHVQQIVRKPALGITYYRTFFEYDRVGRMWMAIKDQWTNTGGGPTGCTRTWAREFRYDSGRARYLMRARDPSSLAPSGTPTWTDYSDDWIYQDYSINGTTGAVTELARYMSGEWREEVSSGNDTFFHDDLVGTTRRLTNGSATVGRRTVYSAFGQLVFTDGALGARYGYVGGWGYEGDPVGGATDSLWGNPAEPTDLLHVGERLYDPALGRFIMRDPTGIAGGTNTYAYVDANPVTEIDPAGTLADPGWRFWLSSGLSVSRKVSTNMMGASPPISTSTLINPVAKALEAGPDLVRIGVAKKTLPELHGRRRHGR